MRSFLSSLLILLTVTTAPARLSVCVVQQPAGDAFSSFCIDETGAVYQGGEENWEPASTESCPALGPYDVTAVYDAVDERILLFVVAGDGSAYIVGPTEWIELAGLDEGDYRLSGCTDAGGQNALLFVIDDDGRVSTYTGEGWAPVLDPVPGPGPFDIHAFATPSEEVFFIDVINGDGVIHRAFGNRWLEIDAGINGEAPFSLSAYNTDEAAYHFVADSAGRFWMLEDGAVINQITGTADGESPYDMDVYINRETDTLAVLLCDSHGVIHNTDGEGWQPQNAGLEVLEVREVDEP